MPVRPRVCHTIRASNSTGASISTQDSNAAYASILMKRRTQSRLVPAHVLPHCRGRLHQDSQTRFHPAMSNLSHVPYGPFMYTNPARFNSIVVCQSLAPIWNTHVRMHNGRTYILPSSTPPFSLLATARTDPDLDPVGPRVAPRPNEFSRTHPPTFHVPPPAPDPSQSSYLHNTATGGQGFPYPRMIPSRDRLHRTHVTHRLSTRIR